MWLAISPISPELLQIKLTLYLNRHPVVGAGKAAAVAPVVPVPVLVPGVHVPVLAVDGKQ